MNNKKIYICVSLGSPEIYLDFYGEVTSDIKLAAKCTSRNCAKILVEEYKTLNEPNDKIFIIEEYISQFSIGDFIDDKIIIPMDCFAKKHPNFIFWLPIVNSIIGIIISTFVIIRRL